MKSWPHIGWPVLPWLKKIMWVIEFCRRAFFFGLMFQQPVQKPSSESSGSLSLTKYCFDRSAVNFLLRNRIHFFFCNPNGSSFLKEKVRLFINYYFCFVCFFFQAKSLGLLDPQPKGRGRGIGRGRGRGITVRTRPFPRTTRVWTRDSASLDHRTTQISVADITPEQREDLAEHFRVRNIDIFFWWWVGISEKFQVFQTRKWHCDILWLV